MGTAIIHQDEYARNYLFWLFDNAVSPALKSGGDAVVIFDSIADANPGIWRSFPEWADILKEGRAGEETVRQAASALMDSFDKASRSSSAGRHVS